MSRARRAAVLGGLALVLGSLAASDVAGREAALRRELGPVVGVLVTRAEVPAGAKIRARALAVRRAPERYAPAGAFRDPAEVVGARAGVAIPAGTDLQPALLAGGGEVWAMTSLLGVEGILRGIPVTCLGAPFYAGWGLTRELGPVPDWRG
ncbi:MAG TPA: SAF domain-containing protein, partial [Solirubrobacteraceae bacterium]|nr:SAF domain-containing protein [Solirubrobacteraceae bacterium]